MSFILSSLQQLRGPCNTRSSGIRYAAGASRRSWGRQPCCEPARRHAPGGGLGGLWNVYALEVVSFLLTVYFSMNI